MITTMSPSMSKKMYGIRIQLGVTACLCGMLLLARTVGLVDGFLSGSTGFSRTRTTAPRAVAAPASRKRTSQYRSNRCCRGTHVGMCVSSGSRDGGEGGDGGLILGLNKYSHDSAVCIIRGRDGKVLFAGEKERLTRNKHDGGDTGDLVQHALASVGASLKDVQLVVSNNHHHRVAPFERRIPWSTAMGVYPASYASAKNLIPTASARAELSHHLAHAWSAAELAPFDRGLIVVMDGMGEAHSAMAKAEASLVEHDKMTGGTKSQKNAGNSPGGQTATAELEDNLQYYNDVRLMREMQEKGGAAVTGAVDGQAGGGAGFQQVPEALLPHESYREAESAYTFAPGSDGGPPVLTPVYKRWTRERSPPELYNHGFENMESMGAVYSRVSSHIFGDWNACGKVMGLAPWASQWAASDPPPPPRLTSGNLLFSRGGGDKDNDQDAPADDDSFRLDWDAIENLWRPNELGDPDVRPYYAGLAATAQAGLEEAAMAFVTGLRERTGEANVCLCGGVALNSVLNGRVAREAGFERTFVPPCPGDEGIAVGCAAFGWHHRHRLLPTSTHGKKTRGGRISMSLAEDENKRENDAGATEVMDGGDRVATPDEVGVGQRQAQGAEGGAASPFWGRGWSEEEVEDELEEWEPWVNVRPLGGLEDVAEAIASGQVVGWFQGRGEFGPRALGSRSLLADPRDPQMPARINTSVKKREDFRPFAPSVLAEEADAWFQGLPRDGSPYMSLTAPARREVLSRIPAVCHVDGSSRLQTVREKDNPLYHKLITAFFELTGVPMVLNTSFNVMGEPIVDSPEDAIRALVSSQGAIAMLVMHGKVVTLRPFPPDVEAREAAVAIGLEDGENEDQDEIGHDMSEQMKSEQDDDGGESWEAGLRPFQAKPFMSEVIERDSSQVVRVRVLPEDGRGQWIDLDDEFQLEILALADGSLTIADMVGEAAVAAMEDDEIDDDDDVDGGRVEGEMEASWAEQQSEEAVLGALRVLYSKGLIGFDRLVEAIW